MNIGISLESLGVKNWALNRKNALDVLHHFESLNICVLGGDVYILTDKGMEQNYDSWYFDIDKDIPKHENICFSIKKAIDYIEAYPIKDAFFSIVPLV
ncbi:hypothetical protein MYA82_004452 [Salmonella enterica subsp. enterica serovar Agona]|uniref:Immunity protein 40 domain-containing protein n=1 Tax=Salmonella enterica TaxID=28901 RepID=A0A753MVD1_SALER|nr:MULTISPECIES: Imm40 family immunity protein [Salmonella]EIR7532029.1 hypothetical protein [Salmonella enterica subsp. enterica serovar Llandoff]MDG0233151.1 Imm40 family immunity protein [Salmonella enterica subsp. enterica]HCM2699694.1 hypothetical protein [Salmonella enterica subsp. enterica serovar Yaba]EDH9717851.1 hypothetical protein [Salmonella enterica subsp. enterica serovar Agona]EDI3896151.1 hypothetical protein [Salmonella enterica subsp. enterica serovar Agona]